MSITRPDSDNLDPATRASTGTVLGLLIDPEDQRPWSTHELALEIGSAGLVEDAIADLHGAGLVHKTSDGFVFATRAAIRHHQIAE